MSANRHLRSITMTDSDHHWDWDLGFQSIDTTPQHTLEPAAGVDGKTHILALIAALQLLMSPRLP